jgi:putative colanic acid biosynthesis acetyltransferase WcaF
VEKTDLSKYDNSWYHPGRKAVCIVWYFVNVLFFVSHINPSSGLKIWLLQLFGAKVGRGVVIKAGVNIKYPWKLVIGDYSWIGEDVWIDNLAQVTIGSNVCISQGAMLLTGNHNYKKTTFDLDVGDILLEDGVWIGAFSIVCPGVKCQSHAVLSVNSVATKKLEPYTIYQGNPARKVRKRVIE